MDLIINFLSIFCSRWTYYELCRTKTRRKYLRLRPVDTTDTLSFLERTHCLLWTEHTVSFGQNTLSSLNRTHCLFLDRTHCSLSEEHIVFFGRNTLSSVARRHCPFWQELIVFIGKKTLSSLERTHCLLSNEKSRENLLTVPKKFTWECLYLKCLQRYKIETPI